jgi:hypothetical protein
MALARAHRTEKQVAVARRQARRRGKVRCEHIRGVLARRNDLQRRTRCRTLP